MPHSRLAVVLLSVLGLSFATALADQGAPTTHANNDPLYVKLRNVKIGSETIHVKDFTLKKDAGTFLFRSGVFSLLEPVNGKITGAVFQGDASFSLTPPTSIEKKNLAILTKGQPFEEQFSSAVFRFTDGTETEIRKAAIADIAPASGNPANTLADVQEQLKSRLKENLSARLLEDVLSSRQGGKFVAFIKGNRYSKKMIYDIDPEGVVTYDPDPLAETLGKIKVQGKNSWAPDEVALSTWDDNHYGIWAAFHFSREYATGTASSDEHNKGFSVSREKLDIAIDKSAALSGTAQTTIVAEQDGVRVIALDLFPTLRVQAVTGPSGEELSFVQEPKDEDADFAVILPRELKKGDTYVITTKYAGRDAVMDEGGGNYYPLGMARERWYPWAGLGNYAQYEMTFRVPKGMRMTASGKLVRSLDEGNETITEWTTDVPQTAAAFNFGKFKRDEAKPPKQDYLLETFVNPESPDVVKALQHSEDEFVKSGQGRVYGLATLGSMSTVGMMKKAMGEAQLAVELYTEFFGEAPYKRLAMTQQTHWGFGQSFPGLVYLPITYFFDDTTRHQLGWEDARGYFKVVGPHEIAHQWWGDCVGWNSYRDQWMSEGFAEMSASLFLQAFYRQHGLDEYHKFWADERWLMTLRNKEGKRAVDVGPLTMGYRLSTAKTGYDIYFRLIYPKGAYVLQMLRFMLQTGDADPDSRFKAMMHEFTRTYANRTADTEDFKSVVEKYMTPQMNIDRNGKMNWFFDEFVYGTEYPSYKFEHSFSNDASGDVVLNFKLTQSDVSKDFAMLVPVYLDMGGGRAIRVGSAPMVGNVTLEQHIPLRGLKERPKRALIAYYDDVMGNIDNR